MKYSVSQTYVLSPVGTTENHSGTIRMLVETDLFFENISDLEICNECPLCEFFLYLFQVFYVFSQRGQDTG